MFKANGDQLKCQWYWGLEANSSRILLITGQRTNTNSIDSKLLHLTRSETLPHLCVVVQGWWFGILKLCKQRQWENYIRQYNMLSVDDENY